MWGNTVKRCCQILIESRRERKRERETHPWASCSHRRLFGEQRLKQDTYTGVRDWHEGQSASLIHTHTTHLQFHKKHLVVFRLNFLFMNKLVRRERASERKRCVIILDYSHDTV